MNVNFVIVLNWIHTYLRLHISSFSFLSLVEVLDRQACFADSCNSGGLHS